MILFPEWRAVLQECREEADVPTWHPASSACGSQDAGGQQQPTPYRPHVLQATWTPGEVVEDLTLIPASGKKGLWYVS